MTYFITNAIVGLEAEKPDPANPSGGAELPNYPLYLAADTGKVYHSTGQEWVQVNAIGASLPGVTGQAGNPPSLIMTGHIIAEQGFGNNASLGPDAADPIALYDGDGNEVFQVSVGPVGVGGAGVTVGNSSATSPSGLEVQSSSTQSFSNILRLWNANGVTVAFTADGHMSSNFGIGLWAHTPPAAQPTLATGASHTVDDVIALLQSYGLCKQA